MPTKIRLQRHGRKGYAFYHIVIANSRAPRDGKFIERIGSYNPNTNPATIDLKFDRALYWLQVGAQPTDTVKNILSTHGVLLKKHLLGGVKKGAFTEAEAEAKFQTWLDAKQKSTNTEISKLLEKERAAAKTKLEAEKAVNKVKADALAVKKAALAVAAAKVNDEVAETVTETTTEATSVAEDVVEEATTVTEDVAEEATTVTEDVVEEATTAVEEIPAESENTPVEPEISETPIAE